MIAAFTIPALGHIKPMLPLLRGLVGEGQKVVCFGHKNFENLVRSAGIDFEPYPDIGYDVDFPDFNLVKMGADLLRASEIICSELEAKVASLSPSLILQDSMALWASRIGTQLGVPRIHTIPTLVFNSKTEKLMRKEDGVLKLLGDVMRGSPSLFREMVRTHFSISIREAFGLEKSWRKLEPPMCELVFSIEELQAGVPEGDIPRHYIGPPEDDEAGFELIDMSSYALITFGTLSNNSTQRFESAMRGVCMAGYSAVAICGRKVDVTHLNSVGDQLEGQYPGLKVRVQETVASLAPWIGRAEFVVHHAGMATTWETIRRNKPGLFIPTNADQKVLATLLEHNGFGLRLSPGFEFDAHEICRALVAMRGFNFPQEQLNKRLMEAGGVDKGVEVILSYTAQHR
jgi:UDP:flavonoid glycosyltransferase YjiC (YdhE family)